MRWVEIEWTFPPFKYDVDDSSVTSGSELARGRFEEVLIEVIVFG
jgi:hypothetical protein